MAAVEVERVSRVFETREGLRRRKVVRTALADLSLTVEEGSVHGLLGPNGAGKTTLVKILSTILLPTSGVARVFGRDVVRDAHGVRRSVGLVLGGDRGHYHSLTARQNLRYWAAMYGYSGAARDRRVTGLIERFGLARHADSRVETFSRGMKQRLHLARGVIGDSPLILLDEPTVGMDPVSVAEFREVVREFAAEGRTLLVTTHDMVEAEELCHQVSLIDGGRLITTESPRTLSTWITRYEHVDVEGAPAEVRRELADLPGVSAVEAREPAGWRVSTAREGAVAQVLACLLRHGITSVQVGRPSLAEVYVHLVGRARGLEV